jgi:hypothetical protein
VSLLETMGPGHNPELTRINVNCIQRLLRPCDCRAQFSNGEIRNLLTTIANRVMPSENRSSPLRTTAGSLSRDRSISSFPEFFLRGGNNLCATQFGYVQDFRLQAKALDRSAKVLRICRSEELLLLFSHCGIVCTIFRKT